jgi:hypothetical protein
MVLDPFWSSGQACFKKIDSRYLMEKSPVEQRNPKRTANPVSTSNTKERAIDRFKIFEQVALERLQRESDSTKPVEIIPLPVRLTAVAATTIAIFGLIWSVLARVPVQVNGTAAIIPMGGLESINAQTSGILRYQVSGYGPDTLSQKQRQRNQLLSQFWLEKATQATVGVKNAAKLSELVKAALATPTSQTLLLTRPLDPDRNDDTKSKYAPLTYPEGTILAYLENEDSDQNLSAILLDVLPSEKIQRNESIEKVKQASTLSRLDSSHKAQANSLKVELEERRELYKRYLKLWKNGDLPGITLLDEQSRINALEGQLLSANSNTINSGISRDKKLEESVAQQVAANSSLNKLENSLIEYLNATVIFAPLDGFYILTRNFLNGANVKEGDELITFTKNPPALPRIVPIFLDSSAAQQVSEGMKVLVTPKGISRAQYGGIPGRVIEVNKLPLQGDGLKGVLGSRALVAMIQAFTNSPNLVRVELEQTDSEQCQRSSSYNCYRWSSGRRPPHPVRLATLADVQITTNYRRPLEFVMPAIKNALGLVVDSK